MSLEEVFDNLYEQKSQSFIKLIDTYCGYRNDDNLSSPKTFNSLIDDKGNFYSILVRFEDKPILSE